MFNLNDTMRYFLCPGRTDMRKGISSLCGVVHEKMNSEVKNGDVFIFIGSSRRLMKLLHAEDGGMVMYVKRLEAGRFKLPEYDPQSNSYPMEWRDLVMMVEGIQENPQQRLRSITLGRKNYLFCGNHEAAANMSVICSLLATCKAHDVTPRDYLNDVIARMPYHKKATHEELLELLPHKWKLQHPESALTKQEEEAGNRC
ncbi:IS66 family insertion sequence element accessory protein TnpB [Bacteroides mediterraneensis]|uniref:IS66 family insertion sequence element accessory protein TnpB n=1 Tax=Bacteroides mediterraneensis TaxID=1841856 RepID=UPI0009F8CB34